MTVHEYFKNEANLNATQAEKSWSKWVSNKFSQDAEKWKRRAALISPEVAAQDVDHVLLWRIIEEVDKIKEESKR